MTSYDAVVVGAGPNGLVAANRLADAGWSVLVLEAQPSLGGAVRSDRELDPDFVHDTFSAFYPLAAASPAMRSMELERHGLEWVHAPAVLANPVPGGQWAVLHRDRHETAAGLEALQPGDGEAWLELASMWDRIGEEIVTSMLSPFPPLRAGAATLRKLPQVGGLTFVRELLSPVADLASVRFAGEAPRVLLAGNASHADIAMHSAGSSVIALILTMIGQTHGWPVPRGGAGALTEALARRARDRGVEITCDAEVVGIEVRDGRAVGVRTAQQRFGARRAVLADVVAPRLYGDLLDPEVLPRRVVEGMRSFRLDPGTVKVDWALDGPVPWSTPTAAGCVHVADSVAQMSEATSQVASGTLPAAPFLLAGLMTTTDPSRSPAGTESMWAYTRVPQHTVRDAGEEGIRGVWDHDDLERYADRMQARIETYAPGFGSLVRARRVLGPRELEARNANLMGGAIGGGTANLQQQLVFRPVPGLGRPGTGVRGLYLASSSAHPGGGVHGAAGMNAARAALAGQRLRLRR